MGAHECDKIKDLQEVIISKDSEIKALESEKEALKKELEKHKKAFGAFFKFVSITRHRKS